MTALRRLTHMLMLIAALIGGVGHAGGVPGGLSGAGSDDSAAADRAALVALFGNDAIFCAPGGDPSSPPPHPGDPARACDHCLPCRSGGTLADGNLVPAGPALPVPLLAGSAAPWRQTLPHPPASPAWQPVLPRGPPIA